MGELSVVATAALATKSSMRSSPVSEAKTGIWSRSKKHESHSGDITKATNIQFSLLPGQIPDIPGYDMRVFYESMDDVGGDYYDFIPIDGVENLGIIIADASGHGFSGAMVMTMARSLVRMLALRNPSAKSTMIKLNKFLTRDIKNVMFLTTMYMVLNIHTRTLQITNAGHNPLILFRGGRHQLINPTGMAIGFDAGPLFEKTLKDAIIQLQPGDRIIAYTDGVVEAMNKSHEEFGMERFLEIVHEHGNKSSSEFVRTLMGDLRRWLGGVAQNDDITVLTFRYVGDQASKTSSSGSSVSETSIPESSGASASGVGSQAGSRSGSRIEDMMADGKVSEPVGDLHDVELDGFVVAGPALETSQPIQPEPVVPGQGSYMEFTPGDDFAEGIPEAEALEVTPFPEPGAEDFVPLDDDESFSKLGQAAVTHDEDATAETTPEDVMENLLEIEHLEAARSETPSEPEENTPAKEDGDDVVDLEPKPSDPPAE
jgi:hypothetical protein